MSFRTNFRDLANVSHRRLPGFPALIRLLRAGTRKVRLTPTQVAIARKLGLTVEQYARYVKD
jgi:hypothetical protein